jgi:hypothetical protein
MNKDTKTIQIITRESVISSIIKDTYSFLILGFFFWFNYRFIGGSYIINSIILLCCFVFILKTAKNSLFKVNNETFQKIKEILENEQSK